MFDKNLLHLHYKLQSNPSPSKGIVNFDFAGAHIQSVTILDIMGKTVFESKKLNQSNSIDISALPNGLYMINMDGKIVKLIKQ